MFIVYGVSRKHERLYWPQNNGRLVNGGVVESDAEYSARMDKAISKMKKQIGEYSSPAMAREVAGKATEQGMENVMIKFRKLVATGNVKRPVSETLVDISELGTVDPIEQSNLRAMLVSKGRKNAA